LASFSVLTRDKIEIVLSGPELSTDIAGKHLKAERRAPPAEVNGANSSVRAHKAKLLEFGNPEAGA
jgi:hypothetical protein